MTAPILLGASLKMYLSHARTLDWARAVTAHAAADPAVADGRVEVALLPSFVSIDAVSSIVDGSPVAVGAQDVFWEPAGAYTGEVDADVLAELGCRYVELGHAERRRIFGEDDGVVAGKLAATARAGLVPLLCAGELERADAETAAADCAGQVERALASLDGPLPELVVAYEPVWAIGAAEPAEPAYVRAVVASLRARIEASGVVGSLRVIYGGSAGPGTLPALLPELDGLFLGRFAHDPDAFARILAEAGSPAGS